MFVDPSDTGNIQRINGYKSQRPGLKLMLSVGGWNFPSGYFSQMVSSSTNRQKFIQSALSWMSQYGADGIDIDWEYPCSPARVNPVEITCTQFQTVNDPGGKCPADTTNFVAFLKDLRSAFGTKYLISVASQAAHQNEIDMDIADASQYVDWWHVMTYDYAVSDIPDASGAFMSPNAPLYTPSQANTVKMSISDSINDYLTQGVPAEKIMVGIPLYGHTWYQPSLVGTTKWQTFGNQGVVEGKCCGPFQQTFGGIPGKGSLMCGTMMYSETQAAKPSYYYDTATQSAIGFFNSQGSDGYTTAGTWLTYNDLPSVKNITSWTVSKKLRGIFIYDTSMDSIVNGQFTYELMNGIADSLGGH